MDPASALPPRSGYRRRSTRLVARLLDLGLDARQLALGGGRVLDRAAEEAPRRRVAAMGIYGPRWAGAMTAAVERLRDTRHELAVSLGALGDAAPELADVTVRAGMESGKFGNLNRVAEDARPLTADWVLLIDDDVVIGRRFLDRLVCVAEHFRMQLVQPALTRTSHTPFPVTRRRAALARLTRFVETGPVTLMHRDLYRVLSPFPEAGMGWGACLHWAAIAERHGWRLGVVDAVPVRHDLRPPAAAYEQATAREAARRLLADREHLTWQDAEQVLASYRSL